MSISRREFLRRSAAAAGAVSVPGMVADWVGQKKMPTRPFGKTGWNASIYALGSAEMPDGDEAVDAVRKLMDGGVNYLDTAWSYRVGRSETTIGKAVKGRRDTVFITSKTERRSADDAYREITESLKRLDCGRIDLLQVHSVNDDANLDLVLKKGGAVEGLERAQKEGLIKHIGITGHKDPAVILRALKEYPFESILVPVSALDKHIGDFAEEVLPLAKEMGIGIAGMKSLLGMKRATQDRFEAPELVRYAMSLPISTLTIGLVRLTEVEKNLKTALDFKPMTPSEMARLEESVKQYATTEYLWWKGD